MKMLALTLSFLSIGLFSAASDDFPLRAKYKDVQTISTEELIAKYDQVQIVDVRASVEYEVCKINTAVDLQVTKASFVTELEKIRAKDGDKTLVFYCNGHTCSKSYKAWVAADEAGFSNILAYDGGIFYWIEALPAKATLLGETPADPAKIIAKADFKAKSLTGPDFVAKAEAGGVEVFDIRELLQRRPDR
jgi:rhodanese-related sulfurtransferase